MTFVDYVLFAATIIVALPILLVAIETLAAIFARIVQSPAQRERMAFGGVPGKDPDPHRPSVAVLIPAHDEERVLCRALASILPQLNQQDRLVVVADNCTDETAEVARAAGAEVVERNDTSKQGKGYALAAGFEYLRDHPPQVLTIIDADMSVSAGALDALVAEAMRYDAAVQAVDLLDSPARAPVQVQVSALAFTFKNLVRALGADALGIPCLLRGTGMAFPWHLLRDVKLASGNIVEDMQLGMDLAVAKSSPRFCPEARVTGRMPDRAEAASIQRTRWEHGHLQTILHKVVPLFMEGIKQRRPELMALACDLAVPPLALLVLCWCALVFVTSLASLLHLASNLLFLPQVFTGGILAASVLAGWAVFGRRVMPLRRLLAIPGYIWWKIPLYVSFIFKRQQTWVRTERPA